MRAKGALKPHTADRVRALVPKFVLSLLRLSTDCFTSLTSQPEARKAFLAIVSSAGASGSKAKPGRVRRFDEDRHRMPGQHSYRRQTSCSS